MIHSPYRLSRMGFLSSLQSAVAILAVTASAFAFAVEPPAVLIDGWEIELVAAEPDLVTPISCRFDRQGRLLVVESHTHFPPGDYAGPATDRIYLFDDTNGDGRLDRQRLFYEGGTATMGLEVIDDDWVVVATRNDVQRMRDSTGDGVADQVELLLRLESTATYPHNGLGGLAIGPDGYLYVGQGENLGEPYVLVGTDGSRQSGGGEGGNIFRCRTDGSDLQRWATGFWNPFGLHFDSAGRLWAVCNDPDARPPCRLLHVVQGADYGFQFRFGRAGTHPLQAWDGEQPGTLAMAAGTGEAPCAVVTYGDALWVTSWGDHRLERYHLEPQGASWKANREVVLQGGSSFRPVDFAVAADGSIYFTDWVDRSYPVHGKGRLWRLVPKGEAKQSKLPELSDDERAAVRLASDTAMDLTQRLDALNHADPFMAQAATTGLVNSGALSSLSVSHLSTAGQWVALLTARRWFELTHPGELSAKEHNQWIAEALRHPSADVCRAAIRWAAERNDRQHIGAIRALLKRDDLPDALFASAVAGIAYLETGSAARGRRDPALEQLLVSVLTDADQPAWLRAKALRMLPVGAESPTADQLANWGLQEQDEALAIEAVRLLVARGTAEAAEQLAVIAQSDSPAPEVRADAVAGLARHAAAHASVLGRLAQPQGDPIVRHEARRVQRRELDSPSIARPDADDLDGWERLVGDGGDPRAGWRVFTRTTCVNCHTYGGRGAEVGPELTTLAAQRDRRRILQSILQPSKEVGPLYVSWRVMTDDGRVLVGMKLDGAGAGNRVRFLGADGDVFEVPLEDIRAQQPSDESIMPRNLQDTMSIEELRDLVAFLAGDS